MISFEWYRTFKTIYECDSISEASKKLFMTQPGVSKQLSALESRIRKKLFVRTARKTIPTEYGKFLYTQISAPIIALEKAETYFTKNEKKRYPNIVIGCSYDYYKMELSNMLPELNMAVTLNFGTSNELAKSLENETIDILMGISKYNMFQHSFTKINTEKLVLVASNDIEIPNQIFEDKSNIKALEKWIKHQSWFAFDNELPLVNMFWKHHFNKRTQIMAKIVFPSFIDIINTMKIMNGLCIMPLSICQEALNKKEIKIAIPNLDLVENKLYCSNKSNSENLYEIRLFKEKMNIPL